MAQNPYIPPKEADLFTWATNFAALITLSPATYGLLAADALVIQTYVDDFTAAYTIALNPATRTGPSVADKDAKRAAMLGIVRPYAQDIRNNAGVSNLDKLALGLIIPVTTRTPILVPATQPILEILAATPLQFTMRYADSGTPSSRSKPFGARHLWLAGVYAATVSVDPDVPPHVTRLVTTQPLAVDHDPLEVGKICTIWGRWVGIRGDVGPWSLGTAMQVVGAP